MYRYSLIRTAMYRFDSPDASRAALRPAATTQSLLPKAAPSEGRSLKIRAGKFGGVVRAKRRAKIAVTVAAVEINDEMTPIKATTNELEMTKSGDVVGRAVAGATAGALASNLARSNQKMQATATAVGAVLGMLGKAKQITIPAKTEMHFLLAAPLQVAYVPELPEEDTPVPIAEKDHGPTYLIEIKIDGRSTMVSLQQSLFLLRQATEKHTTKEASELLESIEDHELRLQALTDTRRSAQNEHESQPRRH